MKRETSFSVLLGRNKSVYGDLLGMYAVVYGAPSGVIVTDMANVMVLAP